MSWESWEKTADKGPGALIFRVSLWLIGFAILFSVVGYTLGWFGEAGEVAKKEFGPKASLKKYEWFKDAIEQLNAKTDAIAHLQLKIDLYHVKRPKDFSQWSRQDLERLEVMERELFGLKLSFTQLAAEYNANMEKVNWKYAADGELPRRYTWPHCFLER